jgi:hypothetical protein
MAGFCEQGDEPSDSTKGGEFFLLIDRTVSVSRRTLFHVVR